MQKDLARKDNLLTKGSGKRQNPMSAKARLGFFVASPGTGAFLIGITLAILFIPCLARSEEITLKASWYSIESLKKEGTYKCSKGVMANGEKFNNNNFTCANRLYPLGAILRVTCIESGKSIVVKTTDRISRRFGRTRIDLSRLAFSRISELEKGIIPIRVERIK
jgi:rare lipoprotein A